MLNEARHLSALHGSQMLSLCLVLLFRYSLYHPAAFGAHFEAAYGGASRYGEHIFRAIGACWGVLPKDLREGNDCGHFIDIQ